MADEGCHPRQRRAGRHLGCPEMILTLLFVILIRIDPAWGLSTPSRRSFLATVTTSSAVVVATTPGPATAENDDFVTRAYGQAEYTNSITASRDTNISPAEAYDVIRQHLPRAVSADARAADIGAGAGCSTAVLYKELKYHCIDAVDWSADAWESNVQSVPSSVRWFQADDDSFFADHAEPRSYDAIVYNFAINYPKAQAAAKTFLKPGGRLLAPVNDRLDYWFKQSYIVLDDQGTLQWRSDGEVGAWSVQFQPDVTADTCTGSIWCGGFNGFQKTRG